MTTPVDMLPVFWLLVVSPLVFVAVVCLAGMTLVPASHVDPGDLDDEGMVGLTDDGEDACPACGEPIDLTGHCGCSIAPRRRLERERERWS